jgi:hypothetical protein
VPFSRICAAAAGLTLVITIVAVGITVANRSLTHEVAARQQLINRAVIWGQINTRLASSLAAAAERDNDERIRGLLEENGVTLRASPSTPATSTPQPPKTSK